MNSLAVKIKLREKKDERVSINTKVKKGRIFQRIGYLQIYKIKKKKKKGWRRVVLVSHVIKI